MSKYYELHVFTAAQRSYAEKVLKLIDPSKKYFKRHFITRDEMINTNVKSENLPFMFRNGTQMVVILDDIPKMWNCLPNVLKADSYNFFPVNAHEKINFDFETRKSVFNFSDDDRFLEIIGETLINIHSRFFEIIRQMKVDQNYTNKSIVNEIPSTKSIIQQLKFEKISKKLSNN